jgi:nitroimidazol reductase NimA-like FMN-containing flavoprotein (pyridoxamine 5'-phosphate oxidase superfamily)
VSRRDQIRMTEAEQAAFLEDSRVLICATNGVRGWPHLMPLWYVIRDGELWAWTYASSQKVLNLERDPRATLQLEAGESYDQLRGVMIEARTQIHSELDVVAEVGAEIAERYMGATLNDDARAALRSQAAKRVGLQFVAQSVASWDHRKLGGTY